MAEVTQGAVERARVLAAYVEIALAAGDVEAARAAAGQLGPIAEGFGTPYLRAAVGYARGSVLLAGGDATAAMRRSPCLGVLAGAGGPVRGGAGPAAERAGIRRLDDHDTAEIELDAARRAFERLGAVPALAESASWRQYQAAQRGRADAAGGRGAPPGGDRGDQPGDRRHAGDQRQDGGSPRGQHVHQARVSSRAAATAYAYEHSLM